MKLASKQELLFPRTEERRFADNSQLSSCILHLCVSMGNSVRSSGQERVMDNLEQDGGTKRLYSE